MKPGEFYSATPLLFFLAPRDPSRSMMRAFGAERGSIVHNRDPLLSAVAYQTLLRIFPSMSFRSGNIFSSVTHRNRSRSSSLEPHRGVRSSRALVTGRLLSDDDQRFSTTLGADDPLRSHFRHTLAPLRDPIRSSPSWIIDDACAPTMPPVIVFLLLFFFFRPTVLYRGASIVREPVEGSGRVI